MRGKSTKMSAGFIKRRRIKLNKLILDQETVDSETVHDGTARSQVSQVSRVSHSPFSAQRTSPLSSPLSSPLVSPVSPISNAQPIALYSPVKPKSEVNPFFKRERIKKVKSILKSTTSFPDVKEGRSVSEYCIHLFVPICVNAGVPFEGWKVVRILVFVLSFAVQ